MKSPLPRLNAVLATAVLAGAFVAGCASDRQHSEALALIEQQRYEEGFALLDKNARESSEKGPMRAELLVRRDRAVLKLVEAGRSELNAGRLPEAQALFERALAVQPGNTQGREGLAAVDSARRRAETLQQARDKAKAGDTEGARAALALVLRDSRDNREALELQRQLDERDNRASIGTPALRVKNPRPVNLEFRDANLKMVFDALSRSSGVNFVFDKDVRGDAKTTIYARQVTLEDAIDLILLTNQLEKKVIAENALLIYPSTQQKLRDYQDLVIRSFYLENADVKTTFNMIKTMLKTRDAFVDEKLNLIVMRDTPEAIRLAEKLIAAHDLAEPEVLLEVEVIEVGYSRLRELGVKWTDKFTFGLVDPTGGSLLLNELRGINSNRVTVSSPSATLSLGDTDGQSNVLASPRVRVKNRDKARIMIGDRVPVISSQITPSTGNPVVTENVSYLDVGIKLDVEPTVHLDGDVSIKIGLEVSNLGERTTTQNGTIAYRVGTRNASTSLRLRDGETQVLMGLIRDDDRRAASKVPGIAELPVLSHLFGSHTTESTKSEIVLSITPRIVRNVRRVEARVAEFWSGTETNLRSQPQYARTIATAAAPGAPEAAGAAGAPAAGSAAALPPSGIQLLWQGPAEAKVGDEVTLVLKARTAETLVSAAVQVGFDASTLEFVRITEGEFMKQGGVATAMNHRLDAGAGTLNVRFARAGGGATGEGNLASLTFRVKDGAQTAKVQTLAVSPVGPGNQPIALAAPAPHQVAVSR
ncbi:MAG TPA: cohesin domain-containing protein [Usitatibacteraceae bacterium]|nr:cohesin domain-containing protein [Usitatibacteraceae bacterium]